MLDIRPRSGFITHSKAPSVPPTGPKRDPVLGIIGDADTTVAAASCAQGTRCCSSSTDGLFEVEGADAQQHDQNRLLRFVRQRAGLHADELCTQLIDDVQQFAGPKGFADDVCLIAMEIDHLIQD